MAWVTSKRPCLGLHFPLVKHAISSLFLFLVMP